MEGKWTSLPGVSGVSLFKHTPGLGGHCRLKTKEPVQNGLLDRLLRTSKAIAGSTQNTPSIPNEAAHHQVRSTCVLQPVGLASPLFGPLAAPPGVSDVFDHVPGRLTSTCELPLGTALPSAQLCPVLLNVDRLMVNHLSSLVGFRWNWMPGFATAAATSTSLFVVLHL